MKVERELMRGAGPVAVLKLLERSGTGASTTHTSKPGWFVVAALALSLALAWLLMR